MIGTHRLGKMGLHKDTGAYVHMHMQGHFLLLHQVNKRSACSESILLCMSSHFRRSRDVTGRVTGGNNTTSPESGARPVLSLESRVVCQPAEHTRWKFSESDGPLRPVLTGPGFSEGIQTDALWQ